MEKYTVSFNGVTVEVKDLVASRPQLSPEQLEASQNMRSMIDRITTTVIENENKILVDIAKQIFQREPTYEDLGRVMRGRPTDTGWEIIFNSVKIGEIVHDISPNGSVSFIPS